MNLQKQHFGDVDPKTASEDLNGEGEHAGSKLVHSWVEVRSKQEILETLDENGRLNGLPFMPEMLKYCGRRFRIYKSAHKGCDTVSGDYRGVKISDAVHLDLRCDGSSHGGCQAGCLLYWNEAWLKPVDPGAGSSSFKSSAGRGASGCTETQLVKATEKKGKDGKRRYACQATQYLEYSEPLPWWDIRQYIKDYTSGNSSLAQLMQSGVYGAYTTLSLANRRTLGIPGRWLYDRFQQLRNGIPFPRRMGKIPGDQPTPREDLNIQPGEIVRIKSYADILSTINEHGSNRKMQFDADMVPYCGGTYRVRSRIERFIDERTGEMRTLKTPAVILEDVFCLGCYSHHRMQCPRSIYSWWREIWLERVSDEARGG